MTTILTSVNKKGFLPDDYYTFSVIFLFSSDKPTEELDFTLFRSTTCLQLTQLRDLDAAHWHTTETAASEASEASSGISHTRAAAGPAERRYQHAKQQ